MRRSIIGGFIILVLLSSVGFDKVSKINVFDKDVKQTYVMYRDKEFEHWLNQINYDQRSNILEKIKEMKRKRNKSLTSMEALDLIKEVYAKDFERIYYEDQPKMYFYKLATGNYYLTYNSFVEDEGMHIIQLYEYVVDDVETGLGHAVTYGWYGVHQRSGEVTERNAW